jgi:hypothetical protein
MPRCRDAAMPRCRDAAMCGRQAAPRRVGRRPTPGRLPPPSCEAPPGHRSLWTGELRDRPWTPATGVLGRGRGRSW